MIRRLFSAGLLLVAVAGPASAQAARPAQPAPVIWNERVRIGVSAGVQPGTLLIDQDFALEINVEPSRILADESAMPLFVDGSIAFPFTRSVALNVAVSLVRGSGDTDITAEIPHPFHFDQPRTVTGTVSDVEHQELVVHAGLAQLFRLSATSDFVLSGGVSWFRVSQDLVDDVLFDDEFPFDTATFVDASVTNVSGSGVGFHVGADMTWKMSARWGIGVMARYSRGSVPFSINGDDAGKATVGGLQLGGGVRWMIPPRPRRPAPPPQPPRRPA